MYKARCFGDQKLRMSVCGMYKVGLEGIISEFFDVYRFEDQGRVRIESESTVHFLAHNNQKREWTECIKIGAIARHQSSSSMGPVASMV